MRSAKGKGPKVKAPRRQLKLRKTTIRDLDEKATADKVKGGMKTYDGCVYGSVA